MIFTNINERIKFSIDKKRNRSKKVLLFIWCTRILNTNNFFFLKAIAKILCILYFDQMGLDVDSSNIGAGVRFPHLNGIFIHKHAHLGENCTVFHQVTIGSNEHKKDYNKAPSIGNNVYIGVGAKIIGNISIGDNVKVGTNAVVTKDVPAGITVIEFNKFISAESERKGII